MKLPEPEIFSILSESKNYSISTDLCSYPKSSYRVFIGCSVIHLVFSFHFVLYSIITSFRYPFLPEINSLFIFVHFMLP